MSAVMERVDAVAFDVADEAGDPAECAHIVYVPTELRGEHTAASLVFEARVNGTPVTALCGYTWVPQKDPEALPVCSKCVEIYQTTGHDRPDS